MTATTQVLVGSSGASELEVVAALYNGTASHMQVLTGLPIRLRCSLPARTV
ncbi:MAG TPA: hypothetical protein VNF92_13575 [Gemmatimonadaceae bacterium]|nr:hypothetical protein [Gemmatimonadaceae bacterium]